MIALSLAPTLAPPSTDVRISYLVGEQADMLHRGASTDWLDGASSDFSAYVSSRRGVQERWGVSSEVLWFSSGEFYLGSLVIRHQLTNDEGGGHIGYHVVRPWQGRGHATAMLRQGLSLARARGIEDVLLTVDPENVASTRVVEKAGGIAEGINHEGERRFWVPVDDRSRGGA